MQRCGEFEIVRELAVGRDASLYSTQAGGRLDSASLAVKLWHFADATLQAQRTVVAQRAAVAAGCTRLAPIHASGSTEEGCAYYVTNRYALSVLRFIEGRNKVSGKFLERLCTDTLRGLAELYEKCGRAHGNLNAGNILLDGNDSTMRTYLSDLAPDTESATTPDDLYELGCIIYQIVRHVARRPSLNPPVEFGPEWEFLDDEAESWLVFCNLLLNRRANSEPDAIHTLLQKLRKIDELGLTESGGSEGGRPRSRPSRRSGLGAAVAVVLFLGALGGGFYFWKGREAPRSTPVDLLSDEQVRELVEAARGIPELNVILATFAANKAEMRTKAEFQRFMGEWSVEGQLVQAEKVFEERGWTPLRLAVARAGDLQPNREFGRQLELARRAAGDYDALEERWDRVKAIAEELHATGDESIIRLADWPQQKLAEVGDLAAAKRFAEEAAGQLKAVADYLDEGWKDRVDQTRFRREAKIVHQVKVDPAGWLAEARTFERASDENIAAWRQRLSASQAVLAGISSSGTDATRTAATSSQEMSNNLARTIANALLLDRPAISQSLEALQREALRIEQLAHQPETPPPLVPGIPPASGLPASPAPLSAEDPEYARFTAALREFKAATIMARTLQEARNARTNFENSLAGTPKYLADPTVKDLLVQLTTALEPGPLTLPALTRAGWVAAGKGDLNWAVYRKEGVEVPFHRVEVQPGGEAFALSAIELPAAIALRVRVPAQPPGDGPRVWQRTGDRTELARSFIWPTAQECITAIKRNQSGPAKPSLQLLAPGLQSAPSADAPLNFVSLADAGAISQALGGEIPTVTVWRKAVEMAQAAGWTRAPHLRGKAWQEQAAHLTELGRDAHDAYGAPPKLDVPGGGRNLWPDRGSYAPSDGNDGIGVGGADGNELWFSSVSRESAAHPEGIYDLVGNVAEYVNDNGRAAIIGGSAISSPAVRVDLPVPVTFQRGYSDVGLRLAVRLEGAGEDQLAAFKDRAGRYTLLLPPASP